MYQAEATSRLHPTSIMLPITPFYFSTTSLDHGDSAAVVLMFNCSPMCYKHSQIIFFANSILNLFIKVSTLSSLFKSLTLISLQVCLILSSTDWSLPFLSRSVRHCQISVSCSNSSKSSIEFNFGRTSSYAVTITTLCY